jgi:hypothetical protein
VAVAELLGELRRQLEATEARAEDEDPRHGKGILFGRRRDSAPASRRT